jgi:hypothetical protein
MPDERIIVLAGTHRQYTEFLRRKCVAEGALQGAEAHALRSKYYYATDDHHLHGFPAGTKVIIAEGTFWREKRDAYELWHLAQARDYDIEDENKIAPGSRA